MSRKVKVVTEATYQELSDERANELLRKMQDNANWHPHTAMLDALTLTGVQRLARDGIVQIRDKHGNPHDRIGYLTLTMNIREQDGDA
jgi:hypothetical protein